MQNWLSSIDELHEIVAVAALLSVCMAALVVGGVRERLVAAITLIDAFGVPWLEIALDRQSAIVGVEIKAVLVVLAYGAMSWRWTSRWLIVLTALQFLTLLLLLARLVDGSIPLNVNSLVRNVVGWLMLLTLAVAALKAAQARWIGRARRQA